MLCANTVTLFVRTVNRCYPIKHNYTNSEIDKITHRIINIYVISNDHTVIRRWFRS